MSGRNRAGVKRRIVELAQSIDPNVEVVYGWPDDEVTASCLYLDTTYGDASVESMSGGPGTKRLGQDRFTIPTVLAVMPFTDHAEAQEAAEAWVRDFDALLRRLTRLKDPTGAVPDGTAADYEGVATVSIAHADGPGSAPAQVDGDVIAGGYLFDLACVSDLI